MTFEFNANLQCFLDYDGTPLVAELPWRSVWREPGQHARPETLNWKWWRHGGRSPSKAS